MIDKTPREALQILMEEMVKMAISTDDPKIAEFCNDILLDLNSVDSKLFELAEYIRSQ